MNGLTSLANTLVTHMLRTSFLTASADLRFRKRVQPWTSEGSGMTTTPHSQNWWDVDSRLVKHVLKRISRKHVTASGSFSLISCKAPISTVQKKGYSGSRPHWVSVSCMMVAWHAYFEFQLIDADRICGSAYQRRQGLLASCRLES
eukprot:s3102_g2.t1